MNTSMEHVITQEAGAWLFRLRDDRSGECWEEFSAWLQTSPQHVAEFLLATATDLELGALDFAHTTNIDKLLADVTQNVVPLNGVIRGNKRKRHQLGWVAGIAASLAVMTPLVLTFRAETYRTDIGEQRTVKLADGSVVQLNTRSRIEVDFSAKARVVQLLEGEALFTVAQEASRPFEVRSGDARIQAVGTQFNVYQHGNGLTVSVIEGRVKVLSGAAVLLDAGQEAAIETGGRAVKSAKPEVSRALAWRQRHLEFRSATVAEVAGEFNRYNRLQIRIADAAVANRSMSGFFNADEPQSLLDFLSNEGGIRIERSSQLVILHAQAEP
jgi:transmembrane sensor